MNKPGRKRKERYARLMGGFWRNEKARRLSLEATGLLTRAWSYSADQMTDGRVPLDLLRAWAGKRYPVLMKELAAWLEVPEGAVDAQAHDWIDVNITAEEWETRLERDAARKKQRHAAEKEPDSAAAPPGNPPDIPPISDRKSNGYPPRLRTGALDEDEDEESLRETKTRARDLSQNQIRDPMLPVAQRPDVLEVHTAWKAACGFPKHKFRSAYDHDAGIIAEAIGAYGIADCLLVANYAPNDGMVSGKRDEKGRKHDTIKYIFGNSDAFSRILHAAQEAAGKSGRKRSALEAVEAARRL